MKKDSFRREQDESFGLLNSSSNDDESDDNR